MGSIVEAVVYEFVRLVVICCVIGPISIIFLGYIIYIVVEVIKELRKK